MIDKFLATLDKTEIEFLYFKIVDHLGWYPLASLCRDDLHENIEQHQPSLLERPGIDETINDGFWKWMFCKICCNPGAVAKRVDHAYMGED